MRLLFKADTLERILNGDITAMILPTQMAGMAQAKSFGFGIKDYYALKVPTDDGLQMIEKGKSYEIASAPSAESRGRIFIQGIDKDYLSWTSRYEMRRLGIEIADTEDTKTVLETWWNLHFEIAFKDVYKAWIIHFALHTDTEQEIPTDSLTVRQINISQSDGTDSITVQQVDISRSDGEDVAQFNE